MMTAYTVFHADGSVERLSADLPRRPGYKRLDPIIMAHIAAPFERVAVWHEDQALDMFVDETGQLKRLPHNAAATAIYRANTLRQRPETNPESLPTIVGVAVLFHRPVWF